MSSTRGEPTMLAVLYRRSWVVLLMALVFAGLAAGGAAFATPLYESVAEVLVLQIAPLDDDPADIHAVHGPALSSQAEIAGSEGVHENVKTRMSLDQDVFQEINMEVVELREAGILRFVAQHDDPVVAQEAAQATAEVYLQHRGDAARRRIQSFVASLESTTRDIENLLDQLSNRIERLPEEEAHVLREERDQLIAQYGDIATQASIKGTVLDVLDEGSAGRIVQPAMRPDSPIWPKPRLWMAIAAVLGGAVGGGLVIVNEFLLADRS